MPVYRKISVTDDVYLIIQKNKRNHTTSEYLRTTLKKDVKKTEIIKNQELEIERLKEEMPQTQHEIWRQIGCPAMLLHPDGYYVCANKAPKIVKVPFQQVCIFCWERQLKLKTSPTPQTSTSTLYKKKPEKIYCVGDTLYIDPLKSQAKCQNCKTKTLKVWAECQLKQRQQT